MELTQSNIRAILRTLGILAGLLVLFVNSGVARAQGDTLYANQRLYKGQFLRSQNGVYELRFQPNGDLALYGRVPIWLGPTYIWHQPQYIWHTGTMVTKFGSPEYLVMQDDWNLVIYGTRFNSLGRQIQSGPHYASNTMKRDWFTYMGQINGQWVNAAAPYLRVQNDGKLSIFAWIRGNRPNQFSEIWHTKGFHWSGVR